MLFAAFVPIALWWHGGFPAAILAASVALLPGFVVARQLWTRDGLALNPLLGKTAGVLLLFTLVFSLTCLFS